MLKEFLVLLHLQATTEPATVFGSCSSFNVCRLFMTSVVPLKTKTFISSTVFNIVLRPQTVASSVSPSLRIKLILTGIVCSRNCYIYLACPASLYPICVRSLGRSDTWQADRSVYYLLIPILNYQMNFFRTMIILIQVKDFFICDHLSRMSHELTSQ